MYYKLGVDLITLSVSVRGHPNTHISSLLQGTLLPEPEQKTFRYLAEVDEPEDDGEPDADAAPSFPAYYPSASIMDEKLVKTLLSAGVDNIEVFDAVVEDEATGEEYHNFKAVNVVGFVSCADEQASTSQPLADVKYFFDLVVDESRAGGQLMFRLAEQPTAIIVHEQVAKAIEAGSFSGLTLTPVSGQQPA